MDTDSTDAHPPERSFFPQFFKNRKNKQKGALPL